MKNVIYRIAVIRGVIVIFFTLPIISYRCWLLDVAEYLIVQDELSPGDVIIVISGWFKIPICNQVIQLVWNIRMNKKNKTKNNDICQNRINADD